MYDQRGKPRPKDNVVRLHISYVAFRGQYSCHGTFNGYDYNHMDVDKGVAEQFMRRKVEEKCGHGTEIHIIDHTIKNP